MSSGKAFFLGRSYSVWKYIKMIIMLFSTAHKLCKSIKIGYVIRFTTCVRNKYPTWSRCMISRSHMGAAWNGEQIYHSFPCCLPLKSTLYRMSNSRTEVSLMGLLLTAHEYVYRLLHREVFNITTLLMLESRVQNLDSPPMGQTSSYIIWQWDEKYMWIGKAWAMRVAAMHLNEILRCGLFHLALVCVKLCFLENY